MQGDSGWSASPMDHPPPASPAAAAPPGPRSRRVRGGWALEAGVLYLLYRAYSWIRSELTGSSADAFANAERIIDWQERLRLMHERTIQRWFLDDRWFIGLWNVWYGTAHYVMPVVTLVWLYVADPARYVRWRNVLLWMLPLALLGFWLFPLTPPRLLPEEFGFVDTRLDYFTLGEQSRAALRGANPFAAMPSLHIGWATACAIALWPRLRHWWSRALLAAYPAAMLFSTVVTGNHYFLDAVGAWIVLGVAYVLASAPSWIRVRRATAARSAPAG
jgi:membrane-associated phospholipid phosphatase